MSSTVARRPRTRHRFHWILAIAAAVLAVSLAFAATGRAQSPTPSAEPVALLRSAKTWGYQLQNLDIGEVAASQLDLVVIDYSKNGVDAGRFSIDEVRTMQRKPDGTRRLVIAYMSIGEAEDYRFYWNPKWVEPAPLKRLAPAGLLVPGEAPAEDKSPPTVRIPRLHAPGWLGRENERWNGNYHVRFWYEGWQELMFYDDKSYLARIIEAGFDGVYLDRVDAFYAIEVDRPDATRRMVDLVADFAAVARKRKPSFLVIAQNAEELLRNSKYLAIVNGIAKEDLLFGSSTDGTANAPERIKITTQHLMVARAAGLPVLVVEYLEEADAKRKAAEELHSQGFVPYFAPRKLDRLVPPLPTAK